MRVIIFLFLSVIVYSCIQYKEVKFNGIENFKVKKFSTKNVIISFDVKVYNPNNYKIKVKPSEVEVLMGKNKLMGTAKILDKIVIEKEKSGSYPVTVEAKLSDLLISGGSSLIDLVRNKSTDVQFRGHIKVKARGIWKKIELDEKQSIDISRYLNFP